jgi:hypothetical protein
VWLVDGVEVSIRKAVQQIAECKEKEEDTKPLPKRNAEKLGSVRYGQKDRNQKYWQLRDAVFHTPNAK